MFHLKFTVLISSPPFLPCLLLIYLFLYINNKFILYVLCLCKYSFFVIINANWKILNNLYLLLKEISLVNLICFIMGVIMFLVIIFPHRCMNSSGKTASKKVYLFHFYVITLIFCYKNNECDRWRNFSIYLLM